MLPSTSLVSVLGFIKRILSTSARSDTDIMWLCQTEVLAVNNRLKHLYNISDLYDELVAASKGEVRAKITTAQVLEPEELEDIKAGLSTFDQHCFMVQGLGRKQRV